MPKMSAPLFDLFEPAPFRGSTTQTRAASASGARRSLDHRQTITDRLAVIWRDPHTMQDVAGLAGVPINIVSSRMADLKRRGLVAVGRVEAKWPTGRATLRTVWRMT
jgi:hypothetical protein